MSNGYRAKWRDDSSREAEVHHFKKLIAAEKFLDRIMSEARAYMDEKDAAVAAGVPFVVAQFGSRATGLDATGEPLPKKEPKPSKEPAKPRKGQPYRARVYAPQMIALGARAAFMLLELAPLVEACWKRLVNLGIDPRRLALEDHDAKLAALLLDEIGVQYHDVTATGQEKLREALDKMEAWVCALKKKEAAGAGGPETGPPEVSAAPLAEVGPGESAPAPACDCEGPQGGKAQAEEGASKPQTGGRAQALYSENGSSLDWTRL